jgi:hypothetical protein
MFDVLCSTLSPLHAKTMDIHANSWDNEATLYSTGAVIQAFAMQTTVQIMNHVSLLDTAALQTGYIYTQVYMYVWLCTFNFIH